MNEIEEIQNPKILMKNNLLVQSKYSLTLNENRIFLLALYKLQKDYNGSMTCYISYSELKEIIKRTNDRTIKSITGYLGNLMKKSIFFMEKKKNDKLVWGQYNFISGYQFDEETQVFKLDVPKKIYDLLNEYLKTGYTPANLALFFSLKNYNAQRLYDLIRIWSGTKSVITYTVDELKMYLMLEDSYPLYGNFKRRVILPAIKELNQTGYFEIDFKENKVGRKIHSIDFIVKDYDKRKYFNEDEMDSFDEVCECEDIIIEDIIINDIDQITFYVPDRSVFTNGTFRSFVLDFCEVDFKNPYMEKAFNESIMITFDRDDEVKIKSTSYNFFTNIISKKIIEYKKQEIQDNKDAFEIDMYW